MEKPGTINFKRRKKILERKDVTEVSKAEEGIRQDSGEEKVRTKPAGLGHPSTSTCRTTNTEGRPTLAFMALDFDILDNSEPCVRSGTVHSHHPLRAQSLQEDYSFREIDPVGGSPLAAHGDYSRADDQSFSQGGPFEQTSGCFRGSSLIVYGVDAEGHSIAAVVRGFSNYFYFPAPVLDITDETLSESHLTEIARHAEVSLEGKLSYKVCLVIQLCHKKPIMYHRHDEDELPYLKVLVSPPNKMGQVAKNFYEALSGVFLKKDGLEASSSARHRLHWRGRSKISACEDNVSHITRFLTDMNLSGGSWVEVYSPYTKKLPNSEARLTRCSSEVEVHFSALKGHAPSITSAKDDSRWDNIPPLQVTANYVVAARNGSRIGRPGLDPVVLIATFTKSTTELLGGANVPNGKLPHVDFGRVIVFALGNPSEMGENATSVSRVTEKGWVETRFYSSEQELIDRWVDHIQNHADPDVLLGFDFGKEGGFKQIIDRYKFLVSSRLDGEAKDKASTSDRARTSATSNRWLTKKQRDVQLAEQQRLNQQKEQAKTICLSRSGSHARMSANSNQEGVRILGMHGRLPIDLLRSFVVNDKLSYFNLDECVAVVAGQKLESLSQEQIATFWFSSCIEDRLKVVLNSARRLRSLFTLLYLRKTLTECIEMSRITGLTFSEVLWKAQMVRSWSLLLRCAKREGYIMDKTRGRVRSSPEELRRETKESKNKAMLLEDVKGTQGENKGPPQPMQLQNIENRQTGDLNDYTTGDDDEDQELYRDLTEDSGPYLHSPIEHHTARYYADPVVILDFKSLYPSIYLAYNLCYSTLLHTRDITNDVVPEYDVTLGGIAKCSQAFQQLHHSRTRLYSTSGSTTATGSSSNLTMHTRALHSGLSDTTKTSKTTNFVKGPDSILRKGDVFVTKHIRRGLVPFVLEGLILARRMAKYMQIQTRDPSLRTVFESREKTLKICANALYGFTGSKASPLQCVPLAETCLRFGNRLCRFAMDYISFHYEEHGGHVIYAQTDSVMVCFKGKTVGEAVELGVAAAHDVSQILPSPITLEFQSVLTNFYCGADHTPNHSAEVEKARTKFREEGHFKRSPTIFDSDVPTMKIQSRATEATGGAVLSEHVMAKGEAPIVRQAVRAVIYSLIIERDMDNALLAAKKHIAKLLSDKCSLSDLIITKGLWRVDGSDIRAACTYLQRGDKSTKISEEQSLASTSKQEGKCAQYGPSIAAEIARQQLRSGVSPGAKKRFQQTPTDKRLEEEMKRGKEVLASASAHVLLCVKLQQREPEREFSLGERIPFVLVNDLSSYSSVTNSKTSLRGPGNQIQVAEDPDHALEWRMPVDIEAYWLNKLKPPLARIFSLTAPRAAIVELFHGPHTRVHLQRKGWGGHDRVSIDSSQSSALGRKDKGRRSAHRTVGVSKQKAFTSMVEMQTSLQGFVKMARGARCLNCSAVIETPQHSAESVKSGENVWRREVATDEGHANDEKPTEYAQGETIKKASCGSPDAEKSVTPLCESCFSEDSLIACYLTAQSNVRRLEEQWYHICAAVARLSTRVNENVRPQSEANLEQQTVGSVKRIESIPMNFRFIFAFLEEELKRAHNTLFRFDARLPWAQNCEENDVSIEMDASTPRLPQRTNESRVCLRREGAALKKYKSFLVSHNRGWQDTVTGSPHSKTVQSDSITDEGQSHRQTPLTSDALTLTHHAPDEVSSAGEGSTWVCSRCTYINPRPIGKSEKCDMCESPPSVPMFRSIGTTRRQNDGRQSSLIHYYRS